MEPGIPTHMSKRITDALDGIDHAVHKLRLLKQAQAEGREVTKLGNHQAIQRESEFEVIQMAATDALDSMNTALRADPKQEPDDPIAPDDQRVAAMEPPLQEEEGLVYAADLAERTLETSRMVAEAEEASEEYALMTEAAD